MEDEGEKQVNRTIIILLGTYLNVFILLWMINIEIESNFSVTVSRKREKSLLNKICPEKNAEQFEKYC